MSEIIISLHGTSFVGPDAVALYSATTLRAGLKMWQAHRLLPTRGMTITKMLALTTRYTGQKYKRTEAERAIADLTIWIETMRSALPVTERGA